VGGVKKPQMPVFSSAKDVVSAPPDAGVHPRPPGAPVLRPETKQMLEDAAQAGTAQAKAEQEKKDLDEKKLEQEAKLAQLLGAFDFNDQANRIENILDNKKRRADIESRCTPMNLEDLLMQDEVHQTVPIIPGKFEPTFRSLTPTESLYIKQRMARETITTDQYLAEKYNLLLLTCSLLDINGTPFVDHRKFEHGSGTFIVDDKTFEEKLAAVMRKSGYVVADLSVNYMWFDIRVRKLLNPDDLKNG